jgi:hypothetical protein
MFGGKLDLVRTIMVCIDGSALCWRCFEDDFLGFFVGVMYEDLVPFWLVTLPLNIS